MMNSAVGVLGVVQTVNGGPILRQQIIEAVHILIRKSLLHCLVKSLYFCIAGSLTKLIIHRVHRHDIESGIMISLKQLLIK